MNLKRLQLYGNRILTWTAANMSRGFARKSNNVSKQHQRQRQRQHQTSIDNDNGSSNNGTATGNNNSGGNNYY